MKKNLVLHKGIYGKGNGEVTLPETLQTKIRLLKIMTWSIFHKILEFY